MIRRVLLVILVLLCASSASVSEADVEISAEYFPDENFRQFVAETYDKDNDGILSDLETLTAATMQLPSSASGGGSYTIKTLKGIEHFPNLAFLICAGLGIESLDLSMNTQLVNLSCSGNLFRELDLSRNTMLRIVSCSSCQIESLDVSGCSSIFTLDCSENLLETLDVSSCTTLAMLRCDKNKLRSLSLPSSGSLCVLYCGYNKLPALALKDESSDAVEMIALLSYGQKIYSDGLAESGDIFTFDMTSLMSKDMLGGIVLSYDEAVSFDAESGIMTFSERPAYLDYSYSTPFTPMLTEENDSVFFPEYNFYITSADFETYSEGRSIEDMQSMPVTVIFGSPPVPPVILYESEIFPDARTNVEYFSDMLIASSDVPVSWSCSGTLPHGLSLSSGDGSISGIPARAGTYTFVIVAENDGGKDHHEFTLNVSEYNAPAFSTSDTQILPYAELGVPYSCTLDVSGTPPFVWSLSGGSLPERLTLGEGVLYGLPERAGTFSFTASAANDAGIAAQKFSLTVYAPKTEIITETVTETVTEQVIVYSHDLSPGSPFRSVGLTMNVVERYPVNIVIMSSADSAMTWTVSGDIPEGLQAVSSDRGLEITGTPGEGTEGRYIFSVIVAGHEESADATITLNVGRIQDEAENTPEVSEDIPPAEETEAVLRRLTVSLSGVETLTLTEGDAGTAGLEARVAGYFSDGTSRLLSEDECALTWSTGGELSPDCGITFSDGQLYVSGDTLSGIYSFRVTAHAVCGNIEGEACRVITVTVKSAQSVTPVLPPDIHETSPDTASENVPASEDNNVPASEPADMPDAFYESEDSLPPAHDDTASENGSGGGCNSSSTSAFLAASIFMYLRKTRK